jgi:cation diffusion facilitator CzcD-associated flavoprotein CzcO
VIPVSEEQIREFETNPEAYFKFRKVIEQDGNTVHGVTFAGSELQKGAVEAFRAMMKKRLANKPEIAEFLTPSFGVGCRRLTPGPGYLEALTEDNVEFVTTKIRSIMPNGVELENGRIVELDALVCATGFNAAGPPPFAVTGRNGASLEERYKPYPETYLSMAIDGFPIIL